MAKEVPAEVRAEAVRRVVQDGESAAETARNIGVSASAVRIWVSKDRHQRNDHAVDATPHEERRRIWELEAEIKLLRQLVRYLTRM